MELLDERAQVKCAIKNWYNPDSNKSQQEVDRIKTALIALDPETVTIEEVAETIGNKHWATKPICDECGAATWDIVEIGEEWSYESSTAQVCRDCLVRAIKLIDGESDEEA